MGMFQVFLHSLNSSVPLVMRWNKYNKVKLKITRWTLMYFSSICCNFTITYILISQLETFPLMAPKGDTSGGPILRRRPLAAEFAAIPTYTPRISQDDGSSTIPPPPHSQVLGIVDPIKTLVPHPPLANDTMPSSVPVSKARRPHPSAADFISSIFLQVLT